jgi:hypothetical protein
VEFQGMTGVPFTLFHRKLYHLPLVLLQRLPSVKALRLKMLWGVGVRVGVQVALPQGLVQHTMFGKLPLPTRMHMRSNVSSK